MPACHFPKAVTVKLAPQNKSGESGTARLTPEGDQTKVEISLKGAPKGTPQPAHIHEELMKGKNAINVHKSTDDIKTYVACGNIARSGGGKKKSGEAKKAS